MSDVYLLSLFYNSVVRWLSIVLALVQARCVFCDQVYFVPMVGSQYIELFRNCWYERPVSKRGSIRILNNDLKLMFLSLHFIDPYCKELWENIQHNTSKQ
jgi:hypothetical protein